MTDIIIGLGLGLFLFLCTTIAYTIGVQHGKELSKGNAPKMSLNPISPIIKAVEKHKEAKKVEALGEELADVMSYSRESALEAVKKER